MNASVGDHLRLFEFAKATLTCSQPHVVFDFSECTFIRHSGVAFVGGLARLVEKLGGTVGFDWGSASHAVRTNLQQNGFAWAFGHHVEPWQGNSVPYREDATTAASKDLMAYLDQRWMRPTWIQVSQRLGNVILGNLWEIYANSFEHGDSPVGVFTCGQHYPTKEELSLCVVDFGVGIPSNVRRHLGKPLEPSEALRWAFERGTTTKPSLSSARGLGLDILKDFVRVNGGVLDVYSESGRVSINRNREHFRGIPAFFQGTLVDITLKCDEAAYVLASEVDDDEPLF